MISNPFLLSLTLLAVVIAVLSLEKHPAVARLFHYLPSPFWCYFLPMLLATFGLLPEKSPVYSFLTTYLLSGCLILLLLNVNLPSIIRLGPTALGALAVGSLGIAAGAVGSFAIFGRWLPAETWKGVGALSASWIGGSANMLAVKEGLQAPDAVFAPMVIVDTVMTYTWMGIMIALAGFQDRWDRWVKADRTKLDEAIKRLQFTSPSPLVGEGRDGGPDGNKNPPPSPSPTRGEGKVIYGLLLISGSVLIGAACLTLGRRLPPLGGIMTPAGWAFLLVTLIGILLSLTPAARLEKYGASRWGYLCLYLLLAAMGSKARLQYILQAPLLIVMAVCWILIHASCLAAFGYFRRIPMFFLAAATQADIGGTASAPIVAGVYQPRLASIGLLLAIGANVVGTYAGFLIGHFCSRLYP